MFANDNIASKGLRVKSLYVGRVREHNIRRISLSVIRFGMLPEHIDPEEINGYLVSLARDPKSPSRRSFKHNTDSSLGLADGSESYLL